MATHAPHIEGTYIASLGTKYGQKPKQAASNQHTAGQQEARAKSKAAHSPQLPGASCPNRPEPVLTDLTFTRVSRVPARPLAVSCLKCFHNFANIIT